MEEANELITVLIIIAMAGLFTLSKHIINRLREVEKNVSMIMKQLTKSNGKQH